VGKPKGSLQILFEKGWVDMTRLSEYTIAGKKDDFGNRIEGTSLIKLLKQQSDFAVEEMLLQQHGRTLGVRVGRSPVAHLEIVGEGVEYNWGAGKIYYRSRPLKEKRTIEGFINLVKFLLSEAVLSKDRVRSFTRHARQYMLGYRAVVKQLEFQEAAADETVNEEVKESFKMLHALMKKCISLFKKKRSHRNAVDFDSSFIKGVLNKMQDWERFGEIE
jgi:hypothetical protein